MGVDDREHVDCPFQDLLNLLLLRFGKAALDSLQRLRLVVAEVEQAVVPPTEGVAGAPKPSLLPFLAQEVIRRQKVSRAPTCEMPRLYWRRRMS